MSKKKVLEAIQLATIGEISAAEAILRSIDPEFVRKRLKQEMSDPAYWPGASELWKRLEGVSVSQPAPTQQTAPTMGVEPTFALALPKVELPDLLLFESPAPFLRAISSHAAVEVDLDQVRLSHVFSLVGMAALARKDADEASVVTGAASAAARFAHAIGFAEVIEGRQSASPGEAGRTVKLRRIERSDQIEKAAREIAALLLPGHDEESRHALKYVIVELLRNVVQHSCDEQGGVVAAQLMNEQQRYDRPTIQIAVADCGVGIPAALIPRHPRLADAREALEKSLWPHFSGAFDEGLTGSSENAGMGLFIISEMAKLTDGRLLIATRGATLTLHGHSPQFLEPGLGFPGTLVGFELPVDGVIDFNSLLDVIKQRARERTPKRSTNRWLLYDPPAPGVVRFSLNIAAEDTAAAQAFVKTYLEPRLLEKKSFALDFRALDVCTQSYLHALLFDMLRLAWARRVPIYIENASPAVRSGLEMLENYALSG